MVAPRSLAQGRLQPVEILAIEREVPASILAGMARANNWAAGKQITPEQFEDAMTAYARRPMGSGR